MCRQVAYLPPPPDRAGRDGGPSGRSREEANERVAKGGRRVTERISAGPYVNVLRRIDTEVQACPRCTRHHPMAPASHGAESFSPLP